MLSCLKSFVFTNMFFFIVSYDTRNAKDGLEYEQNLYIVRMLLQAHSSLASMAKQRYDLIAVLDFVRQVDKVCDKKFFLCFVITFTTFKSGKQCYYSDYFVNLTHIL